MFRNYLVTTIRHLIRQRGFTIINIAGLSIGMAIAILIFLWVRNEMSYDRFNSKSENIYRLIQTQYYASGPLTTVCMPGPIAADIRKDIPEITNSFTYYSISTTVKHDEKIFTEDVRLSDPQLFDVFDFQFLEGNPDHVFDDLHSIVITDKMAAKLFDKEDPMGKVITLNNAFDFKVTGIISETPKNSSFRFDACIPFKIIEEMGFTIDRYGWNTYYVYTELEPHADYLAVNEKIRTYLEEKSREQEQASEGGEEYDSRIDLFLFPLHKMHLYSYRPGERGDIQFIYIFSAIAIFIIIIACINFMNMSTARASKRAREISIRKSIGADRRQLIGQFIGESVIISFLAMLLALAIVVALLPWFNLLVGKELTFSFTDLGLLSLVLAVTVLIGLLAGSYPAFYLSAFNPVRTLRSGFRGGRGNYYFRRTLVVFQFVLSVGLIVGTLVVKRQLNYLYSNSLGMDLENVITLSLRGNSHEKYDVLKQELLRNPRIKGVTRASSVPFYIGSNSGGIGWEGKDTEDDIIVGFEFTDEDYPATLGMEMAAGRFFSADIQSDTAAVVINETAAKAFGMDDPVGKWLSWGQDSRYRIIGVIRDFHHLPMQRGIDPLTLYYDPSNCRQMFIRTATDEKEAVSEEIRSRWESVIPAFPYEPRGLRDIYEKSYTAEARLIRIIGYFALLAIFISCLGLFALSTYMAEQRTKEIGIRKVLGASLAGIVTLVTREFVAWVVIANLIALPVAWFALNDWLNAYEYHTRLSPDIFAIAFVLSMVIALVTVTFQSVSSALKRPVEAIKYE